jgi:hypothetical protein
MLKFLRICQKNIKAPVNALHPETAMSSGSPLPETPVQENSVESEECCICMESLAQVTLSPCNHSKFCLPCIKNVFERNRPCPLCRAPIHGGTIDGRESLIIHEEEVVEEESSVEEEDDVEECCICYSRSACVNILSCGHPSSFCASCIFTVRSMGGPCPICRRLINGFNVDPDTRMENFLDLLSEGDLRFIERESIETVSEFANFFNYSIPQAMEHFYDNWY